MVSRLRPLATRCPGSTTRQDRTLAGSRTRHRWPCRARTDADSSLHCHQRRHSASGPAPDATVRPEGTRAPPTKNGADRVQRQNCRARTAVSNSVCLRRRLRLFTPHRGHDSDKRTHHYGGLFVPQFVRIGWLGDVTQADGYPSERSSAMSSPVFTWNDANWRFEGSADSW